MFSVSTSVVLLVFFVSQGQSTTTSAPASTVIPSTTPHQASSAATSKTMATSPQTVSIVSSAQTSTRESTTPMVSPPSSASSLSTSAAIVSPKKPMSPAVNVTATPTVDVTVGPSVSPFWDPSISSTVVSSSSVFGPPSSSPTTPTEPITKTCAKLSVVIDKPWDNTYKISSSENFRTLSDALSSALKKLFRDHGIYTEVSEVHFTEIEGKVQATAKLCLVFKKEIFIEEVFEKKVETGKLDTDLGDYLAVKNDSAEFEPLGVSFKDWKAKEGECEGKCEGAAGPFSIVKECEPDPGFSCAGLKEPTEETEDCTKYCSSTVATVSSIILVIGIFFSSSFQ